MQQDICKETTAGIAKPLGKGEGAPPVYSEREWRSHERRLRQSEAARTRAQSTLHSAPIAPFAFLIQNCKIVTVKLLMNN